MPDSNETPQSFAIDILQGLRAPITSENVKAIVGWAAAEGGHWNNSARFNPLNTTQGAPGASSINSVGVKSYGSWQQGIKATLDTLNNGNYPGILSALRQGRDAQAVGHAIGQSPWGTGAGLVAQTIGSASGAIGPIDAAGASAPSASGPGRTTTSPSTTVSTTTQVPDQAAYQKAVGASIAGNYLAHQGKDPYAVKQPKTGLASGSRSLVAPGLLSTATPNPADYMMAHTTLSQIAGTTLNKHPGGSDTQLIGQAVHDASAAGVSGAAAKLLRMAQAVIGAPYNQGNFATAISHGEGFVKAGGTDCSGFVSWLMGPQGLGIWNQAYATPSIPSAPGLQAGQGRQITLWNNNQAGNAGHVFIKIGSQYFASEGGVGIRQLPASEVQMYLTQGSDGGHYQAFHPRGM